MKKFLFIVVLILIGVGVYFYLTAPEEVRRKIIFTPHIAGVTADAFVRTYDLILKNILRVQAGEAPESCVRI